MEEEKGDDDKEMWVEESDKNNNQIKEEMGNISTSNES